MFTKRIPCCIDAAVHKMLHMSYLTVAIGTSASEGSVVSEGSATSQASVVSKGFVASLRTTEDHFLLRNATLYYDVRAHCVVMCSIEGNTMIEQQSVRCERQELKTRSGWTKVIPLEHMGGITPSPP